MTGLFVATSTVEDGSMLNRLDLRDEATIKNRRNFLSKHNISLNDSTRIQLSFEDTNFCRYVEVGQEHKNAGMTNEQGIVADAIITRNIGHALFLPIADCVGTVLYDPKNRVLMMSHLGRHSLEQQGAKRSVEYLVAHYNSNPADLLIWLTPAPNKKVYPIWALDNKGMKEAALEQLLTAGIQREHITDNTADTATDESYYSHSEFLKGRRHEDGDFVIVAMMTD